MKKKILVVEDFASIREFVCQILTQKGYETISATNGNDAYQILSEDSEIGLVLSDYNMPGCTGIRIVKKNQIKSVHSCTARSFPHDRS